MAGDAEERRGQPRCVKDVGMHCSLLHGQADQLVTLRNFSHRGCFFESAWNMQPGALVVLRSLDARNDAPGEASSDRPPFTIGHSDPEACMGYRSHMVAKVQRCVKLTGRNMQPRYGVGAEVQILTD